MKILIITDQASQRRSWYRILSEYPYLDIQVANSIFRANDLFLSGLAMGEPVPLVVLHYSQNTEDAHRLMVYWKVQEPSISVLYVQEKRGEPPVDLKEIGLIGTILEDEGPVVLQNQLRFLMQGTRDRQILGIKMQILEEPARQCYPANALSMALSIVVNESSLDSAAFIQFTDKPDEPILQITEAVDVIEQYWLDELCENHEKKLEPLMKDKRMLVDGERYLFPVYSSRGWEGILVFFVKEGTLLKSTDLESLSRTMHLLLERVRINEDLEKKKNQKATYFSLLNDTMKSSLQESQNEMDLLQMVVHEERARHQVAKARSQIVRSVHLLNDIVELARIDDGLMVLLSQSVSIGDTLQSAVDHITDTTAERKIEINIKYASEEELIIDADEKKLEQVFYNLLFYMAHHCEQGEQIELTVFEGSKGNACIKMFTRKSLPDHEICAQIFDRPEASYLLDENKVSLFICKQFVQAHEGTLTAKNDPISGFSFFIQLRTRI